jgi:hypothetical protein
VVDQKKNNLDDLDSIYFFDKFKMRSQSASAAKIPKLDFNYMKSKIRKNEDMQNQMMKIQQQQQQQQQQQIYHKENLNNQKYKGNLNAEENSQNYENKKHVKFNYLNLFYFLEF